MTAAPVWSPEQYARFAGERSRPFLDLMARVTATDPRRVADLGCGTGELTRSLLDRWPEAHVTGVDSSPEMLARAQAHAIPGRLDLELADLSQRDPAEPLDLLVSNAALQWVPDHERLIPRLAGLVAPGGTLAFQVPGNFEAPSHALLAELRDSPRWCERVSEGARRADALGVSSPERYLEQLAGLDFDVDAWETTYRHVLPGENAVLEWVKGTALRPVLSRLDDGDQAAFLDEYGALLREAYPRQVYGTVLPFRRIFVVATAARELESGQDSD